MPVEQGSANMSEKKNLAAEEKLMSARSTALLPLQGKRILVTRAREQAHTFSERLRALGAVPTEFPTIRITPPQDWTLLDHALKRLCTMEAGAYYTWLVFT